MLLSRQAVTTRFSSATLAGNGDIGCATATPVGDFSAILATSSCYTLFQPSRALAHACCGRTYLEYLLGTVAVRKKKKLVVNKQASLQTNGLIWKTTTLAWRTTAFISAPHFRTYTRMRTRPKTGNKGPDSDLQTRLASV